MNLYIRKDKTVKNRVVLWPCLASLSGLQRIDPSLPWESFTCCRIRHNLGRHGKRQYRRQRRMEEVIYDWSKKKSNEIFKQHDIVDKNVIYVLCNFRICWKLLPESSSNIHSSTFNFSLHGSKKYIYFIFLLLAYI